MVKLLDLVRPVAGYLPEVEAPHRKQSFNEKAMWTAWVLFMYLVCCQIPLFGVSKRHVEVADPLYYLRPILASKRGTIMELGLGPLITSGMVL